MARYVSFRRSHIVNERLQRTRDFHNPTSSSEREYLALLDRANADIDHAKRAEEVLNVTEEVLSRTTQVGDSSGTPASIAHQHRSRSQPRRQCACALHWLSSDNPNVGQARTLIKVVLRDGIAMGNIIREIRQLFNGKAKQDNVQLNDPIHQVSPCRAETARQGDCLLVEIDKDQRPFKAV